MELSTETRIVDADAHILEPADLWTARVPARLSEFAPRVERDPKTGVSHWRVGDKWIWPVGHWAQAGWRDYPPLNPLEFSDVQPAAYDPRERLHRMDEYGLSIQMIYPNIIGFQAPLFEELGPELALTCTRAYNDFVLEWCSADKTRLIPVAMLPYWDRDASVSEMERCASLGFRAVLFANKFEQIGLPGFSEPYWDPVYAAAEEMDLPINYHIGFAVDNSSLLDADALGEKRARGAAWRRNQALASSAVSMNQCDVLGTLVTSGLCDRFPRLKLVNVETGFGHIPYYLELLDWNWRASGNRSELLPSEYFRRQCYGTFWFETGTLPLLSLYPDNFMFSTDYPHPTSLSPGPCSPSLPPGEHVRQAFRRIDPVLATKALSGTAESLYKLG